MTKYLALLAFFAVGCAHVSVDEQMQPDHSYKIDVSGNAFVSIDGAEKSAQARAATLCPSGYDTKSKVPEDALKPSYTLVVMCKEAQK